MANVTIIFGYVWAFSFILVGLYFLIKSKDLSERAIGTTIFGNSFSIIFWITYIVSTKISGPIPHASIIAIIAVISILLLISYLSLLIILKFKTQKYYSGYSN